MCYFILRSDRIDPGSSCHFTIHKGDQLNFIRAGFFFLQVAAFLFRVKVIFVGITQQIICFSVYQIKVFKHGTSIGCHAVSDVDCQSLWRYNRLIVFHFSSRILQSAAPANFKNFLSDWMLWVTNFPSRNNAYVVTGAGTFCAVSFSVMWMALNGIPCSFAASCTFGTQ